MIFKHPCMAALALTFIPSLLLADLPSLTVNVTGIDPTEGTLEISLFNSEETFLKKPWSQMEGAIAQDGTSSVRFSAMTEGEYSVVVVHDANGNNKLDNGFLGFGAESFAYSENPDHIRWYRFLFGRPAFEETTFELTDSMEITIELD